MPNKASTQIPVTSTLIYDMYMIQNEFKISISTDTLKRSNRTNMFNIWLYWQVTYEINTKETQEVLHTCICINEYFSYPDYFRCGQTYGLRYELSD